jgi:hypothetical protein
MYKPDHIITIQGHPEFSDFTVKEIIRLRTDSGVFSTEYANTLNEIMDQGHATDGIYFATRALEFVLGRL